MTPLPPESAVRRGIPDATVARLPDYRRALLALSRDGVVTVSSGDLASAAGVSSAQLRKDLSLVGVHGTRGVGYDVTRLACELAAHVGPTRPAALVLVGTGRLGQALLCYPGLADSGLYVAAAYDDDPTLIGTRIGGVVVEPVTELALTCPRHADRPGAGAVIGVIATPVEAAQEACDRLVGAGVRSILTFAPAPLVVPAGVHVRRLDVAAELRVLALRAEGPPGGPPGDAAAGRAAEDGPIVIGAAGGTADMSSSEEIGS